MSIVSKNLRKGRKIKSLSRKYYGVTITPKNRREYLKTFKENWMKDLEAKGNPDQLSVEEQDRLSDIFAKFEVRKEQKHLKAYLRGDSHFKFLGEWNEVLTQKVIDRRLEQLTAQREQMFANKAKEVLDKPLDTAEDEVVSETTEDAGAGFISNIIDKISK